MNRLKRLFRKKGVDQVYPWVPWVPGDCSQRVPFCCNCIHDKNRYDSFPCIRGNSFRTPGDPAIPNDSIACAALDSHTRTRLYFQPKGDE